MENISAAGSTSQSCLVAMIFFILGVFQSNLLKLMFCSLVIWCKTLYTKHYITTLKFVLKEENTMHVGQANSIPFSIQWARNTLSLSDIVSGIVFEQK